MQQDSDNSEDSSRSVRLPHLNTLPETNTGNFGGVQNGFYSLDGRASYNQGYNLPPIGPLPIQTQYFPSISNLYEARQTAAAALNAMSPWQFPNSIQTGKGSFSEDTKMTTPAPSRKTSQVQEEELNARNLGQHGICGCGNHQDMNHDRSTPGAQIRGELSQIERPNVMALPSVLNSSLAQGRAVMNSGGNRSQAQGSQPRVDRRVSISTTTSYSMMSTCSGSTIRAQINIVESRCYLINTLYQTCLDASTSYIWEHPFMSLHCHRWNPRYAPYPTARVSTFGGANHQSPRGRPPTLMDNISTMSTYLWKKARKSLMAPHREEMATVARMSDLYKWGKLIVEARDTEGVQISAADVENNAVLGVLEDGEYHMLKVCKAAREFCGWLADEEAIGICVGVMAELNDLFEQDQNGAIVDIDVEHENGIQ